MSQKLLDTETLDIHAGGRDLIFPHHENEIAQSEALTGKSFAKYWIHHGLLTINSQKMSKSLGNFITIRDFMDKFKNANLLKMFFLSAHYSHPIDYTQEKIAEARQALERIAILLDKVKNLNYQSASNKSIQEIEIVKEKFLNCMDDDFNTPEALACVFELVTLANKHMNDCEYICNADKALNVFLGVLGIDFKQSNEHNILADKEVEKLINDRNNARRNKDFALADKIRKDLELKGIVLEDIKDKGTTWRRKL